MLVELSEPAQTDLFKIGLFIARDSPVRAGTFVDELELACERLGEAPEKCEIVKHHDGFDIHRLVHGNYSVLCQVEKDCVFVVRIVHGSTDLNEVLG